MNSKETLSNRLSHYMDAGFPLLYLETFEELKTDEVISQVANSRDWNIVEYNARGVFFKNTHKHIVSKLSSVLDNCIRPSMTSDISYNLNNNIFVIKDATNNLKDPEIVGKLKYLSERILANELDCCMIIVSPIVFLPPELEHFITVLSRDYPTDNDISQIIMNFCADNHNIHLSSDLQKKLINAFKGMPEYEIRNVLALAVARNGKIEESDLTLILEQKKQIVQKSGILEMIEVEDHLYDQIGGLEALKECLMRKRKIFQHMDKAEKFGVDKPKGLLIAGLPGCGKSLSAKAAADLLKVPLLRLDMGRLMGKYVGESEANLRRAINLADAISPCVLWLDEMEKAFSGTGGQGTNAELTTRLMGTFLTWMQEKKSLSFVIATVNNISKIPPELLRKGRFDDVFYVDLPNDHEREEILRIHIQKRRPSDLGYIDITNLARQMKGYSGADIEGIVKDAIEATFYQDVSTLSDEAIQDAMGNTHPLSETMKEEIDDMRQDYEKRSFKNASWQ